MKSKQHACTCIVTILGILLFIVGCSHDQEILLEKAVIEEKVVEFHNRVPQASILRKYMTMRTLN